MDTEPAAGAATLRRLEESVGVIAAAAIDRLEVELPWFRQLRPEDRAWIGLIVQAGVRSFIAWLRHPSGRAITVEVFGSAPQKLTRVITLQQTVQMVRTSIDVIEGVIEQVVEPTDVPSLREAVMRYGREVAFGTAEVYARAAENRGAWDARLEALVVDSVLRGEADEAVRSRAAALGWASPGRTLVVVGHTPALDPLPGRREEVDIEEVRRAANDCGLDALCSVQGDRMVVVLGGVDDPDKAAIAIVAKFGPGPVVYGPVVTDLPAASASARAAIAGLRAAPGWPAAPRPVSSDDLMPERALSGDGHARRQLVLDVYTPLAEGGPAMMETATAFADCGGSIEATARRLYVHPNTVRYRLKRIADLTGLAPTDPRHAYTLTVALTLGRLRTAVGG